MQYGNILRWRKQIYNGERFKSYYVVWKHDYSKAITNTEKRLNRTMQYGNIFPSKADFSGLIV